MVDREVFERLVKNLKNVLDGLKSKQSCTEQEYLTNDDLQMIVERKLEIAIQLCLDLGSHIISERNLPYPETFKDVFRLLGAEKILSLDLAEKLEMMASFRNVLVHEYVRVDARKVYQVLQKDLKDIEDFLNEIVNWLRL